MSEQQRILNQQRTEEAAASRARGFETKAPAPPLVEVEQLPPGYAGFFRTTFAALAERDFVWFFTGNFAFFMAMQMQFILLGYLAFELTDSAKAVGLLAAANTGPMLLLAPISGTISDRLNKHALMAASQTLAVFTSASLGLLIVTDLIEFWHLLVASMTVGFVLSVNQPARQAMVPQLVPKHKLMNAISLQMGGMNLTRIIAPAMAGLLVAPLGVGWVFLLASALFLAATLAETNLPRHGMTGHRSPSSFREQVVEGFTYIWRHDTIRLLILANFLIPMFAFPVHQSLPIFVKDVFDKGPAALGLMAGVTGIGGLAGAVLAANMDRQPRKGLLMMSGGLSMAVFYIAFALAPWFELAVVLLAFAAVGQMLFMTTNNAVIQANASPEIRGRVLSVMAMSIGLTPLALFPVAVAIDEVGAPAAIASSSVMMLALLVAIFTFAPRLRGLRMDVLDRAELSPAQAATLVAAGKLTQQEADRLAGVSRS